MKKGPFLRACIFGMLSVCLLVGCGKGGDSLQPIARKGVMDLSRWDFDGMGSVVLDGQWAFHWMKLHGPGDLDDEGRAGDAKYVTVPDTWTAYAGEERLSRRGYATYRLKIKTNTQQRLMALRITEVGTACRIFINGKEYPGLGRVGTDAESMSPTNRPAEIVFPSADDIDLILQVSNFDDDNAGIQRSVWFGTMEQIRQIGRKQLAFDLFLFGGLLLIGFYHLSVFILRRKDRTSLLFALFCFIIALRTVMTEERFIYSMIDCLPWWLQVKLEYFTLSSSAVFALFLRSLYPEEFNKKVVLAYGAVTLCYALVVAATPAYIYGGLLFLYQGALIMIGLYAVIMLVFAVRRGREGARIILGGFVVFFVLVVNDILYSQLLIRTAYLIPLGLVFFIISLSLAVSIRFSSGFSSVEIFSQELEQYAQSLEEIIQYRTKELEQERNTLRSRNELIEEQLKLAKRIQKQIIPLASPVNYISALYRPMDHVGGDFYDFIVFRDVNAIGIFISDVSGHGVPAAFITSMIKSYLLQMGKDRENPAALLAYLNSMLLNQTGGHFVTAFYGVFNKVAGRLVYSVAGHNMPFVVTPGGVSRLEGKKGFPLGIMDDSEAGDYGKRYVNSTQTFAPGTRLVLFTDGLVEIVKVNDTSKVFDEESLAAMLSGTRDLPGHLLIQRILQGIMLFRGSGSFDDDICLISLDV